MYFCMHMAAGRRSLYVCSVHARDDDVSDKRSASTGQKTISNRNTALCGVWGIVL